MAGIQLTLHGILCHTVRQFAPTSGGDGFCLAFDWPIDAVKFECAPAPPERRMNNTVSSSAMTNGLSPANLVARSAAFARALASISPPPLSPSSSALFSPGSHRQTRPPAHRLSPRTRVRRPQSPHPQSPQRPLRWAAHRGLAFGRLQPCAPPTALRAAAG